MRRFLLIVLCAAAAAAGADKEVQKAKRQLQRKAQPAPVAFDFPQPFIGYVYPAGVQRGHSVDVSVSGTNLGAENSSVMVSGSGVAARIVSAKDATQLKVAVRTDATAAPGERELRVISPGGVSNRFRFFVGELPEVAEVEPNSERKQPQPLGALPALVNGQVQENDRDFFRIHARAGEKLVLDMQARRIIPFIADGVPGWFDPCVAIYDSEGRELGYADDFRIKSDPVMVFEAPRDGEYTIEVRDIIHRGRGDFVYRLSVGVLPFVSHVFPLGGRRGTSVDIALAGVNLPANRRSVAIPAGAPARFRVDGLPFAASDVREDLESEPNNTIEQARPIHDETVINGRIEKAGDIDMFRVRVAAKQRLAIDVQARRLESPVDSILRITDASGKVLAESDDWQDPFDSPATHHADSRLLHTFGDAGDYFIAIADVQSNGGPEYAYRLMVTPARPDFALRISPDNPRVGQGDTTAVTVDAIRLDGFDREIRVHVEGLPSGFLASEAVIQSGQSQARLTITAPRDAPLSVISPVVAGTASMEGRTVTRRANSVEPVMQAFASTHYMPTAQLQMAVVKQGAFTLSAGDGKVIEVVRGSEVSIPVKVHRPAASKGPVTLTGTRIGKSIALKPVVCPMDADAATLTLTVAADAPVGLAQNLIITGVMRRGRDTITRYAPAIPLKVVSKVQ